jgi:hypothetical protein
VWCGVVKPAVSSTTWHRRRYSSETRHTLPELSSNAMEVVVTDFDDAAGGMFSQVPSSPHPPPAGWMDGCTPPRHSPPLSHTVSQLAAPLQWHSAPCAAFHAPTSYGTVMVVLD